MTSAYNADYLPGAMESMGEMLDYAVNTCRLPLDDFWALFLATGYADQFGSGVPKVVAGYTGTELTWEVLRKAGLEGNYPEPQAERGDSPEDWCGRNVAYFQWFTGRTFKNICRTLSMEDICKLYPNLRRASEKKIVETLSQMLDREYAPTRLSALRMAACYSQRQLAEKSGISQRIIQGLESGAEPINQASGAIIQALARALGCRMTDLLEYDSGEPGER
jgi:DNA-binding Xre family transcriptional regulator